MPASEDVAQVLSCRFSPLQMRSEMVGMMANEPEEPCLFFQVRECIGPCETECYRFPQKKILGKMEFLEKIKKDAVYLMPHVEYYTQP